MMVVGAAIGAESLTDVSPGLTCITRPVEGRLDQGSAEVEA